MNNVKKLKDQCHHCGEKCWGDKVVNEPCYGDVVPIWVEVKPGEWQWEHQCNGHCFLTPGYFPENESENTNE